MSVNLTSTNYQAASTINAGIVGAGVNGPAHAQVGLAVNLNKTNWWSTNAAIGEEDGVTSTIYQGGQTSDASAYLGQVVATGLGFANIMEGVIRIQSPITSGNSSTVNGSLDIQVGVINVGQHIFGSNYNLSLKPSGATAVGYSMNGSGWDYLAQWYNAGIEVFHVTGAGNLATAGAVQTGVFTTAKLPQVCYAGQQLYASDGRKTGEVAGQGSGHPVISTAAHKGYATAWFSMWSGTAVAN